MMISTVFKKGLSWILICVVMNKGSEVTFRVKEDRKNGRHLKYKKMNVRRQNKIFDFYRIFQLLAKAWKLSLNQKLEKFSQKKFFIICKKRFTIHFQKYCTLMIKCVMLLLRKLFSSAFFSHFTMRYETFSSYICFQFCNDYSSFQYQINQFQFQLFSFSTLS